MRAIEEFETAGCGAGHNGKHRGIEKMEEVHAMIDDVEGVVEWV